jgi:shikimate kinase
MRDRRVRSDRGQAVPLVAALVAVAGVLALGTGELSRDVVDAGRARSAADAAALAGVDGGQPASVALAASNGATIVGWERVGGDVVVTVRVGEATATARATGG